MVVVSRLSVSFDNQLLRLVKLRKCMDRNMIDMRTYKFERESFVQSQLLKTRHIKRFEFAYLHKLSVLVI